MQLVVYLPMEALKAEQLDLFGGPPVQVGRKPKAGAPHAGLHSEVVQVAGPHPHQQTVWKATGDAEARRQAHSDRARLHRALAQQADSPIQRQYHAVMSQTHRHATYDDSGGSAEDRAFTQGNRARAHEWEANPLVPMGMIGDHIAAGAHHAAEAQRLSGKANDHSMAPPARKALAEAARVHKGAAEAHRDALSLNPHLVKEAKEHSAAAEEMTTEANHSVASQPSAGEAHAQRPKLKSGSVSVWNGTEMVQAPGSVAGDYGIWTHKPERGAAEQRVTHLPTGLLVHKHTGTTPHAKLLTRLLAQHASTGGAGQPGGAGLNEGHLSAIRKTLADFKDDPHAWAAFDEAGADANKAAKQPATVK